MSSHRILMGKIGAAHGIKGEVRITSYTEDPLAIADYDPLDTDRPGLTLSITQARLAKAVLVARIKGVTDRTAAEALNGVSLYVARARLGEPEDEDEFYHADLIGLDANLGEGKRLGTVVAVVNFGADDLLEIRLEGQRRTVYLPFTRAVVPKIDLAGRTLTIVPPEGWLEDTPRDPEDTGGEDETP